MQTELLIHADWVIPVEPEGVLERHSVAVDGSEIAAILPRAEAETQIQAGEVVELPGHALIPGLINAHTHTPMTLFRGLADDMPLMTWLNEHIWPAEQRWVHEEFVSDGSRLAVAEMLRAGVTCFNDMYFFADVTARVAAQAGMRAVVGLIVIDFPSAWAEDLDGYFRRAIEVHDHYRDHPLVRTAFAPHAPYSVADAPLARVRRLADELELPVHIHVHETAEEVLAGLREHGRRPIDRLDALGLISPNLVAVHMTQIEPDEIERFAAVGAHVVHCPESNLKLASGYCPVARLLEHGVNVAIGSDGAASNNDLDLIAEMRSAALLGKGVADDPRAIPAETALRMATLNGARALGMDEFTGSLQIGKAADLVAIDLHRPETLPVYHPVSQIVYAAGRDQVTQVWIAGRRVLRDGQLTGIDIDQTLISAQEWGLRLREF